MSSSAAKEQLVKRQSNIYSAEMIVFVAFSIVFFLAPIICCFLNRCFTRRIAQYRAGTLSNTTGASNSALTATPTGSVLAHCSSKIQEQMRHQSLTFSNASSHRSFCVSFSPTASIDDGMHRKSKSSLRSNSIQLRPMRLGRTLLPYDPGQRLGFSDNSRSIFREVRSISVCPTAVGGHYPTLDEQQEARATTTDPLTGSDDTRSLLLSPEGVEEHMRVKLAKSLPLV